MKLAIQGDPGSYHEQAAWQYMQALGCGNRQIIYQQNFTDVFASVQSGTCDGAIVAIANNSVGYIHEPYKTLVRDAGKTYRIAGETYVRVEHQLLGVPGATLQDITHVHSQAPAIGQCEEFLQSALPHAHVEEEADTAISAQHVASRGKKTHAAIASRRAGELNGLVPIKENIQDDKDNITRFLGIVRVAGHASIEGANKLTALLTTKEQPGSLASALSLFGDRRIGISSLQSLYIPNSAFRMRFWMDVDAGEYDPRLDEARRGLGTLGCDFTVLGSYIADEVPLTA